MTPNEKKIAALREVLAEYRKLRKKARRTRSNAFHAYKAARQADNCLTKVIALVVTQLSKTKQPRKKRAPRETNTSKSK